MKTVKKFRKLKKLVELDDEELAKKGFKKDEVKKELDNVREAMVYGINVLCWVIVIIFAIPIALEVMFGIAPEQAVYTSLIIGAFVWLVTAYIRGFENY